MPREKTLKTKIAVEKNPPMYGQSDRLVRSVRKWCIFVYLKFGAVSLCLRQVLLRTRKALQECGDAIG